MLSYSKHDHVIKMTEEDIIQELNLKQKNKINK